jgi:hypothetical protein
MLALALEVEGICPVTLVAKSGLLLPGSAACIVRYNNRYYSCVDEASANAFVQSPIMYVQGLINAARRRPELIQLLRLAEYFPGASIPEMTRAARARNARGGGSLAGDLVDEAPRQVQDAQMQTQTHLVDKHIDPSYEFSEWALRRRALQLANLRHKATKSQQTAASHFRKEITTQVCARTRAGRAPVMRAPTRARCQQADACGALSDSATHARARGCAGLPAARGRDADRGDDGHRGAADGELHQGPARPPRLGDAHR